ncbi:TPA: N-6 DNA methylase [Campylobacter jejuni]|nr:N-6 DNA methylase [Campylobacter jejuni]HED7180567.1 N-6 DNA methylase [Campylobacter jejuni]HED7693683.1 N-6 DNA methylase [Campylobacter jejuni]HED9018813.1 N-6 DNA methylase [Campylobacter jejuni]HEF4177777.1 N-6 DNA methylase [Campylobacter jejuni]
MLSEDIIRDNAREILGFYNSNEAQSGVGQITTFNQLDKNYFKGISDKPDGWYFPNDINKPAIILETKAGNKYIEREKEQLFKYIQITQKKYNKVLGILYNGEDVLVYNDKLKQIIEVKELLNKEYYLKLTQRIPIDVDAIQTCTIRINELLHHKFIMQDLRHRMIFTACALVAHKKGAKLENFKDLDFSDLKNRIIKVLEESYSDEMKSNEKLKIIKEQYEKITCDKEGDKNAMGDFIDNVMKISHFLNSDDWNGEDVMMIFFNEFNRYLPKKPDYGQIFTPAHIISLMYRITGVTHKDNVLDAACGSGAFLIHAMGEMISELGGKANEKAMLEICNNRLFGIEISKDLFTLACANMLIHKDGKTNLIQADSRDKEICEWIKNKKITKVLMNPPYENKYGVYTIVENVLDNVCDGAMCAFLLPDNKLEVGKSKAEKWLKKHSLLKIIKLPDEIFNGKAGVSTSIFLFKAHEPQNDKEIFACHIKEDGLETVKNKGRQDTKEKWKNELEPYWLDVIYKTSGDESCQWLKPSEHLSYQMPKEPFNITQKDFKKVVLDYMLFEEGIDKKDFEKVLLESLLYDSNISLDDTAISIALNKENNEE